MKTLAELTLELVALLKQGSPHRTFCPVVDVDQFRRQVDALEALLRDMEQQAKRDMAFQSPNPYQDPPPLAPFQE